MWHAGVSHGGVWARRRLPAALPDVGELLRGAQEAGLLEPAALGVRPSALRAAVAETGEPGGA
jgi:hypothetical protein